MTAKHTPGPWRYESGAVYADVSINRRGEVEGDVAPARLLLADRDEPRTSPCERDRNVELAAAAPELLDFVQRWRGIIDGGARSAEEWAQEFERQAAETIARAEGREVNP